MDPKRKEALDRGHTQYAGVPCGHPGHRPSRYASNGGCVDCQLGTPADRALRKQLRREMRKAEVLVAKNVYRGFASHYANDITADERAGLDRMSTDSPVWLHAMLYDVRNPGGTVEACLREKLAALGAMGGAVPATGGVEPRARRLVLTEEAAKVGTLEDYLAKDWTEELLVKHKRAEWKSC